MKLTFLNRSKPSPLYTQIAAEIAPITIGDTVTLEDLYDRLSIVVVDDIIPQLQAGWTAAGSEVIENPHKLPFVNVFNRIASGQVGHGDPQALLLMMCMNATKNRMRSVDDDVMFSAKAIRNELPRVMEAVSKGSLSETRHMHYTRSGYTGAKATFALAGFMPQIGVTEITVYLPRPAVNIKRTVGDLDGELMIVTSFSGPDIGERAREIYEFHTQDRGDICLGLVREKHNLMSLIQTGISCAYVPQDETISVVQEDGGVKVLIGRVDGAQTLVTEGEVLIGSRKSFLTIFEIGGMNQAPRYLDDLVEMGNALCVPVGPTTEKTKARFLIDDVQLMRHDGGDAPVLIAAIGDFPMPAMGHLPADPDEPEASSPAF